MSRLDLGLARRAWGVVTTLPDDPKLRQAFRSRAQTMPTLLQSSGLAATAASLAAKAGDGESQRPEARASWHLLNALDTWIRSRLSLETSLEQWLVGSQIDAGTYARASRSARDYAVWLKRAAEAVIPPPKPEQDGEPDAEEQA